MSATIRRLRREAEALRARAERHEHLARQERAQAALLDEVTRQIEESGLPGLPERPLTQEETDRLELAREHRALPEREHTDSVKDVLANARTLAISVTRSKGNPDPLLVAAQKSGYTLRSLATKLGIAPSTLMGYRKPRGHRSARKVPVAIAKRIEKLTGFPADEANYPPGLDK